MPFGIIGRTGPGIRQVVGFGDRCTERGTFGGEFGARPLSIEIYRAYVCYSAATRPSCQITYGRLVISRSASPAQCGYDRKPYESITVCDCDEQ